MRRFGSVVVMATTFVCAWAYTSPIGYAPAD